ncbi:hypothetical protein DFH08DRAFT_1075599 [Mycena albidolilacea]|uniref:Uncharacterized protein n=1 Tax=Mycena albidolilacea TaxID=1033008 RepID=A0AAD7EY92_9AGAR|nr:hypothetical protein DFH08DRAFT_1075599 [Mycena albidolilacea]
MLAVLQVGREEMPEALNPLQHALERIGVVTTPPAPPNAPAGPFQPALPAYTAHRGQDWNPFSDIANRVKTGKGNATHRSAHSKSHVYLPDMMGLTSTVESPAKDSEALESLISTLQMHLMRLTSELSLHQELLTELRKLRKRDSSKGGSSPTAPAHQLQLSGHPVTTPGSDANGPTLRPKTINLPRLNTFAPQCVPEGPPVSQAGTDVEQEQRKREHEHERHEQLYGTIPMSGAAGVLAHGGANGSGSGECGDWGRGGG